MRSSEEEGRELCASRWEQSKETALAGRMTAKEEGQGQGQLQEHDDLRMQGSSLFSTHQQLMRPEFLLRAN